ncbi:MAG: DNA polymerase/3'-5' exonuclease PolX [Clostridiales bacterium]|nr:DNA polymerase/3'-5' exonuclease PolX [Clostridiales bacterium]MCF8023114.1 DNA polymerase/3'-5' exonuclease PolX [Clostridiales bacterium]
MRNIEIVWALKDIANYLEFKGDNYYKIQAYRKAARVLAGSPRAIREMYKDGTLKDVPGVGKNILSKIGEMLENGECSLLQRLRSEIPPGIIEIMQVPGLGTKKARLFYENLNIKNLDELEQAARKKQIRVLPGMGAKREQEILRYIKMQRKNTGIFLLSLARELAVEFMNFLEAYPCVSDVFAAGSVRRWNPLVKDLNLLVSTEFPDDLILDIEKHPLVDEVLYRDKHRLKLKTIWMIMLDIIIIPPASFYPALVKATGNEGHWEALCELAVRQGVFLDPEGLYDERGRLIPITSEKEIYRKIGIDYIPPEMRENRGEISLASSGDLPVLLDKKHIKGDLHMHSNWSDGKNSLEELVAKAQEKGYSYVAVTDHSQSLKIARGMPVEKLQKQIEYIEYLNNKFKELTILSGIEVDILSDGSLDYPDDVLSRLDIVVASVHTAFKQDREKMTARIISAIKNPHVDIIGHLTGRILGYRDAYQVDVDKVIEAAAEYNTALEINASPDRMDLSEDNAYRAVKHGVMLSIGTDAHDLRRLGEIDYGISVARRAWLGPEHFLNTMDASELLNYLGRDYD